MSLISHTVFEERRYRPLSEIIVALITGAVTLLGTIITVMATASKTNKTLEINQAVTDTKIDELTREVREHNGFAHRIPVIEEQIKVINHRIDDLEKEQAKGGNT